MPLFTLITGNPHKLAAWERNVPSNMPFDSVDLKLVEIQPESDQPEQEIVRYKLKIAFERLGRPVVVEDVSAGLDKLNGIPAWNVKDAERRLGKSALYILGGEKEEPVTVTCTAGYFDGAHEIIVQGTLYGKTASPAGENGFGFDFVVIPDGETLRMAEMSDEQKDTLNHRGIAIRSLVEKLTEL